MKRLFFIFLSLGLFLSLNSCNNDEGPNFHFAPLRILTANIPDSFELNQTYRIIVTFAIPDGCTNFSGFDVTDSDTTTRNVVVFGTVRTDQDACAQVITEGQASFGFICLYEEPYIFRFWQGEGEDGEQEYFEVIVPVN